MFRFAHPYVLYALILLPLFVAVFILLRIHYNKSLKRFGDWHLVQQLSRGTSGTKAVWKFILLMLAFIFLVLGIADPQVGTKMEEVKREGVDIIIALDVSNSMRAEDIKPNRLERAKQAISRLIDKLQNDRIGLIVFAGKAYVQLPITTDYGAAKLFLSTIDFNIIPTQGTAIGQAIELGQKSYGNTDKKHKVLIVITDGENHEDNAVEMAQKAADDGIIVHTIGMGSVNGAPIPVYTNGSLGGFKKDNEGNTVVTKLDEKMLTEIAVAGKGKFVRASTSEAGLNILLDDINKMEKKSFGSKMYSEYEDRFQYFLALSLLFLLIEQFISYRKSKYLEKLNLFGEEKK